MNGCFLSGGGKRDHAQQTRINTGPQGLIRQISGILGLFMHRHHMKVVPENHERASAVLVFQTRDTGLKSKDIKRSHSCPNSLCGSHDDTDSERSDHGGSPPTATLF